MFRAFMPYGFGKLTEGKKGPIITINYKRVVETWMDEDYKKYFYARLVVTIIFVCQKALIRTFNISPITN